MFRNTLFFYVIISIKIVVGVKVMNVKVDDKLHIGYLIPKLSEVEEFFPRWQLLQKYNKKRYKVFAYVDESVQEYFADKFCDVVFINIADMNSDLITQVMKENKIDILVDLSSAKQPKFLTVLARKAAPIQVSFVGQFNSTNLSTVDYLFTDKYCDPLDQKADYFIEKLYRLPQTHYCHGLAEQIILAKKPAFKENGYITFGSLHDFTSLKDEFLLLWGEILKRVPKSRLILKSRIFGSGYGCQETRYRLKRLNFPVEQVNFISSVVRDQEVYPKIDIILGTFPYQNGYKICEAVSYGLPIMIMVGSRHSVRLGYSILKNIALDECIAFDEKSYVDKTVRLAENSYKLVNLHRNLPERLAKSAMMDERRFIGNVERAYEKIWQALINKKKFAALRVDIRKLLETIKEGLLYIELNIDQEAKNLIICQIIDDIMIALENIYTIVLSSDDLREYNEVSILLIKEVKLLKKIYQKKDQEQMMMKLKTIIIPNVDKFVHKMK